MFTKEQIAFMQESARAREANKRYRERSCTDWADDPAWIEFRTEVLKEERTLRRLRLATSAVSIDLLSFVQL